MATDAPEYQPLTLGEDEYGSPDFKYDVDRIQTSSNLRSTILQWITVILTALVAVSTASAYASLPNGLPIEHARLRDLNLRRPDPYPNLSVVKSIYKSTKSPRMIFPSAIVRTNRESPDVVYGKGSHVLVNNQSSMFYQFYLQKEQPMDACYITAVVPSPAALSASTKSSNASGVLDSIEVWNVTQTGNLNELSWSTRPPRIALLGTLNFTSDHGRDGWQLRPPTPRFACTQGQRYTVEVACAACHIEFEQIFSLPALGFDLQQLG